ncbi:hypothetical protein [Streptomyces roseochromogenus]|uniref:Uncharacterized protein n=1 Tax=Streptomyces roseochromogenus subsp. oscitans DS 12.976 TaxID=1352936 RepID=V6KDU2_STRRC|nr:hypothetical protein M878_18845 [Streptomyces roseochromogenus subsp. oscitans DS 12.976]
MVSPWPGFILPAAVAMLIATGLAVGLVAWRAPGHAGPDPAPLGLNAPVMAPAVLPGLVPGALWPVPAEAATTGALFGTPVTATPVISEAPAGRPMRGQL